MLLTVNLHYFLVLTINLLLFSEKDAVTIEKTLNVWYNDKVEIFNPPAFTVGGLRQFCFFDCILYMMIFF